MSSPAAAASPILVYGVVVSEGNSDYAYLQAEDYGTKRVLCEILRARRLDATQPLQGTKRSRVKRMEARLDQEHGFVPDIREWRFTTLADYKSACSMVCSKPVSYDNSKGADVDFFLASEITDEQAKVDAEVEDLDAYSSDEEEAPKKKKQRRIPSSSEDDSDSN